MSEVTELSHQTSGKYIYALAQSAGSRNYDIYGIDKEAVYVISHGSVSAVVSNCGRQKIRPERAHLVAHKRSFERADARKHGSAYGLRHHRRESQGGSADARKKRRNSPREIEIR